LRDLDANLAAMREVILHQRDADLVIFPELFLSGYTTTGPGELAVVPEGPEVGALARAARESGSAVVFGAPERVGGEVFNSAFCIDGDGTLAGVYRKTHLFGDEVGAFAAGDELLVVDLAGVRVGVMICFDVEFPEVARALAVAGAEMLVTISANMDPFGRDHDVFSTARALENGLPHLYVNQVGPGERFTFAGGTFAVSPDGDVLARAGRDEGVVEADVGLSARNEERPEELRPDYLRERRPPLPVRRPGRGCGA
jgi:predicted amidohydrolase